MPSPGGPESIGEVRVDIRADASKLPGDLANARRTVQDGMPGGAGGGAGGKGPSVEQIGWWDRLTGRIRQSTSHLKDFRQTLHRLALPIGLAFGIERMISGIQEALQSAELLAEALDEVAAAQSRILEAAIRANKELTEASVTELELNNQRIAALNEIHAKLKSQYETVENNPYRRVWQEIVDLFIEGTIEDKWVKAADAAAEGVNNIFDERIKQLRIKAEREFEELRKKANEDTIRENARFDGGRIGADISRIPALLEIIRRQRGGGR